MRVTNSMMINSFMRNLNVNTSQYDDLQQKLSSGKNISKPSDDPVGVVTSLRLRSTLTENEKYTENVDSASAWLETTDIALGQAGDILNRVRELTIQGANDTLPQESRDAIAAEVGQLRQQLLQVSNATHDGRYIFSGFKTNTTTYNALGVYQGDAGTINYEIGVNTNIPINVKGNDVFTNVVDLFALLTNIQNDLTAGNTLSLSNVRIGQLDTGMDNILSIRSDVGARSNRLELTKSRLQDSEANFTTLLSRNEDIDVAKVITELKTQENTYKNSLAAGARIIQPSLMDFLR